MSGTKSKYRFAVVSATPIDPSWGSKFKCLLSCGHTVEATMFRDAVLALHMRDNPKRRRG